MDEVRRLRMPPLMSAPDVPSLIMIFIDEVKKVKDTIMEEWHAIPHEIFAAGPEISHLLAARDVRVHSTERGNSHEPTDHLLVSLAAVLMRSTLWIPPNILQCGEGKDTDLGSQGVGAVAGI